LEIRMALSRLVQGTACPYYLRRWLERAKLHGRLTRVTRRFTLLLLFAVLALPASAQDFVLYPFSTNLNPTVVGAGVTPTLGVATLSGAFIGEDGFGNVLEAYPAVGSTSAALALANSSFFTLALSITPGTFGPVVVNFNVGKGGSSDPRGYFVRTSLDGFASNVLSQTLPGGANQAPAPQSFSLDLTGQSSVTLRFYLWTPGTANSVDFRNLEVARSVPATPLPPSWSLALIGLATAGLYSAWRRRNASVN
jgi:hypothetical protein